jgi:gluconolactonase
MNRLYEVLDDRFRICAAGDQQLEQLAGGCRWAEGPLYVPAGRYAIWSDIPNDRLLRWDETDGSVSTFRQPAGYVNGNTLDPQGRLVSCEQGNRRITRTEHDGSITVLAERYDGKRLNSPNDAAVSSDGAVWFTDPDFGITTNYEGHRADSEIGACNVYRIDPTDGAVDLVAEGMQGPNGIVFSADERTLFVCDSRANQVLAYDVAPDGRTLGGHRVFVTTSTGSFDNIRLDDRGRLWVAAGDDGVHCYDPDGTLIGRIRVPEAVANIRFAGAKRNRLLIAATTSLYSLVMTATGMPDIPRSRPEPPSVVLRPMTSAFSHALLAGEPLPDVRTLADYPTEFSLGMAPMAGTGSPLGPWLIHRACDGIVVGDIGGGFTSPGHIEIGYAIAPSAWGRGYASAAVAALVAYARADPRIEVLVGHTPLDRPASAQVLRKAGFTLDGETDDEHEGHPIRVLQWTLTLAPRDLPPGDDVSAA